jgi:hypothetical protein
MDGEDYFRKVEHIDPRSTALKPPEQLIASSSEQLHEILRCLYQANEVVLLQEESSTIVENLAGEFLDEDSRLRGIASVALKQQRQQLNATGRVRFMLTPRKDDTHTIPKDKLADSVSESLETAKFSLLHGSARMLSRSISHMRARREKIAQGKTTVDAIVRENVSGNSKQLANDIGAYIFHIDVTSTHNGRILDVQANGRKATQQLPSWLKYQTEWDDTLSNMLGKGMLEFDAYFALLEWCIDRRLPMLPVITPDNLERARKFNGNGNTNSDVLLCNLQTNEIIPIQVKNSASSDVRNQYMEGMEFITPSILGISDIGSRPIRNVNGHIRTTSVTTTRYGALSSAYMNKREKIPNKKKSSVSPFQTAFKNFDHMFLG